MKKPNIKIDWKGIKKELNKRSPLIMTGLGITASVGAVITAYHVSPKAHEILKEIDEAKSPDDTKRKVLWDKTKALAPLVGPVVLEEAIAIGCVLGSYKVNSRRIVALSTAYSLSESKFEEYRKQVVKNLGEKKEAKIKDDIAAEKVKEHEETLRQLDVPEGKVRCLDLMTEREFCSDQETLRRIENQLNKRLISEMYISLNDFYNAVDDFNLRPCEAGNLLGWNSDELIDMRFGSQLLSDGTPVMTIDYTAKPRADFRNLH